MSHFSDFALRTDGRMDGWTDRWTNKRIQIYGTLPLTKVSNNVTHQKVEESATY